jgi:DNA-binding NarL/FixJ family response regulator
MRKNILIVSDSPEDIAYVAEHIKKVPGLYDFRVETCAQKGFRALRRFAAELVFAKYRMPGINGLSFLAAVKYMRKCWQLRVFLVDDHISAEEAQMAQVLGAAGCLEKKTDECTAVHEFKSILKPDLIPSFVYLPRRSTELFREDVPSIFD